MLSPHSPTHNWRVHPPARLTFSLVTFPVTAGGRAGESCLDQFPRLYARNGYDKLIHVLIPPLPWVCDAPLPPLPREENSELNIPEVGDKIGLGFAYFIKFSDIVQQFFRRIPIQT